MFGSATLAIVVSSACIKVASMTDTTRRPRLATSRWVGMVGVMVFSCLCRFAGEVAPSGAGEGVLARVLHSARPHPPRHLLAQREKENLSARLACSRDAYRRCAECAARFRDRHARPRRLR